MDTKVLEALPESKQRIVKPLELEVNGKRPPCLLQITLKILALRELKRMTLLRTLVISLSNFYKLIAQLANGFVQI